MGTFGAPRTKAQKKKLRKATRQLLKAFKAIDKCLGDDLVWDYEHMLFDRIKQIHREKWSY